MKNKKGIAAFNLLIGGVIALVVVGILLAVGSSILDTTKGTLTAGSAAANNTDDALDGIGKVADFAPVIGIVIAAVAIIALVALFGLKR